MGLGNNTLDTNGTTEVLFTNKFFMRKGFRNPSHEKTVKGAPSRKPNVSRVTSGHGEVMIPLSQVRPKKRVIWA